MIFKKSIYLLFFSLSTTPVVAQVQDNFEDNDLSTSPEWTGDLSSFITENGVLRSNAPEDGSEIYLSVRTTTLEEQEWQIYTRLDFAPSASNRFRFYLLADSSQLTHSENAVYLELGQSGDDVFKLVYDNAGVKTTIFQGNKIYDGEVEETIKVKFNAGEWSLSLLNDLGTFEVDKTASYHLSFTADNYFSGIVCNYTSTRRNRFYFDNFYSGQAIADVEPPKLVGFTVLNENNIQLEFSEPSGATLSNESFLLNDLHPPTSIAQNVRLVNLSFSVPFGEEDNSLAIKSIQDKQGNKLSDTTIHFNHYKTSTPLAGDIFINEIMADPSPPVDLPEMEYVELWNRSEKHFDLSGLQLNGKAISEEKLIFKRGSYIILCRQKDKALIEGYGETIGMESWDILSNGGDIVTLQYQDLIVDEIAYTNNWYKAVTKGEGGFSLERKLADFPCDQEHNWAASEFMEGGTPGGENYFTNTDPDLFPPEIRYAAATDSATVIVFYNEPLNPTTVQLSDFICENTVFNAISLQGSTVKLKTSEPLSKSTLSRLKIGGIGDCYGNLAESRQVNFVLPEQPHHGDIVINEILFDPFPSGVDYVELYNISEKYLDMKGLALSNDSVSLHFLADKPELMYPGEFLAISIDSNLIINDYPHAGNLLQINSMPSFPNEEGEVFLFSNDLPLDYFSYTADLHLPFLSNSEGVSLERISPENPATDRNNWHSAASTIGYGSPGLKNSQQLSGSPGEGAIVLSSSYFTPNQDGERDFVVINYQFNEPGIIGTFSIYDPFGKKIKQLSNNAVLAASGRFQWDGTAENGTLSKTGHYIILAEVFTMSGESIIFREKVVVVR